MAQKADRYTATWAPPNLLFEDAFSVGSMIK